jgi:hypothetical protein
VKAPIKVGLGVSGALIVAGATAIGFYHKPSIPKPIDYTDSIEGWWYTQTHEVVDNVFCANPGDGAGYKYLCTLTTSSGKHDILVTILNKHGDVQFTDYN